MSTYRLDKLFSPRSVSVVGASPRETSPGRAVLRNLRSVGFKGSISLVNPRYGEIEGIKAVKTIQELREAPDLLVIATPPESISVGDKIDVDFGEWPMPHRHSVLMLAARITLLHFSVSSARSLPKSAGEPASSVPPSSISRVFSVGSSRAALISRLSLSMIAAGVCLGAPRPNKELAS
jgi:hypothetical protein